jgi:hypothetical protein
MNKEFIKYGIIAVLIIYILNRFFPKGTQGGQSQENMVINPAKLTYKPNDYELFADTIETAAWSSAFTEDDQLMFETMVKMMNNDDLYQLVKVYGIRGRGVVIVEEYNLIQTLERMLDNDYKEQLNEIYAQRGINYRFSLN